MKAIRVFLVLLAATGCPTAPVIRDVVRSSRTSTSVEAAWASLVDLIADRSWAIQTIDKESGLVATEWMESLPRYVDCGTAPLATIHYTSTRISIRIRPRGAETEIVINAQFRQMRSIGDVHRMIDCYSTGVLEAEIREGISGR